MHEQLVFNPQRVNPGNIIKLSSNSFNVPYGERGVVVNAKSLSNQNECVLRIIFSSGKYIFFTDDLPLLVIGHTSKLDKCFTEFAKIRQDIMSKGFDKVVTSSQLTLNSHVESEVRLDKIEIARI